MLTTVRSNGYSSLAIPFTLSPSFFVWFFFFFGGAKERGLFSLVKSLQMSESCLAFLKIFKMKKTNIFKHFFQFML